MTREDILKKLKKLCEENGQAENDVLKRIEVNAYALPNDYSFELLSSVRKYVATRQPKAESIDVILQEIDFELLKEISKKKVATASEGIKIQIGRKHKFGIIAFLSVLLVLAAVAVICAIGTIFSNSDILEQIAQVFGYFDFAVGVVGFAWERISDMKNENERCIITDRAMQIDLAQNEKVLQASLRDFIDVPAVKKIVNTKVKNDGLYIGGDNNGNIIMGELKKIDKIIEAL